MPPSKQVSMIADAPLAAGRPRKLTRQRIVEAAVQALEAGGFKALTARSLALKLGVNHATLYNYVGHIEDIEKEALESLMARVPIPDADHPKPMRQQLVEHLLAVRELQMQHPQVLHAPVGSPAWQNHMKATNRVLRALNFGDKSLVEVAIAYNTLIATMAISAERARGTVSTAFFEAQREAILALPPDESELLRRPLVDPRLVSGINSAADVLNHLIDKLLPDIDKRGRSIR